MFPDPRGGLGGVVRICQSSVPLGKIGHAFWHTHLADLDSWSHYLKNRYGASMPGMACVLQQGVFTLVTLC
jgi:hypothetical protein